MADIDCYPMHWENCTAMDTMEDDRNFGNQYESQLGERYCLVEGECYLPPSLWSPEYQYFLGLTGILDVEMEGEEVGEVVVVAPATIPAGECHCLC